MSPHEAPCPGQCAYRRLPHPGPRAPVPRCGAVRRHTPQGETVLVFYLRINKRISVNTNIKKKTFQAFVLILKRSSGKILKYLYKNRK